MNNQKNISVNVIHTPGYNPEHDLLVNEKLLKQLLWLADYKYYEFEETDTAVFKVNIFINGKSEKNVSEKFLIDYFSDHSKITHPLHPHVNIKSSLKRLPLGQARYEVSKLVDTDYFIQMDEDDCFTNPYSWVSDLHKAIQKINTPTAFFRFNVVKDNKVIETYPNQFDTVMFMRNKKKDVTAFTNFLTSEGVLYSKDLKNMLRPFINFAEDDLTFINLCTHYPETTFIPLVVAEYHTDNSVMSKDDNQDSQVDYYEEGFNHILSYMRMQCVDVINV